MLAPIAAAAAAAVLLSLCCCCCCAATTAAEKRAINEKLTANILQLIRNAYTQRCHKYESKISPSSTRSAHNIICVLQQQQNSTAEQKNGAQCIPP